MNQLNQTTAQTLILLDSQALINYLDGKLEEAFLDGYRTGRRAELAARASAEEPLTKQEAARVLGCSEGTIDNLRNTGELEFYKVRGQVRIERSEVERYKRLHTNNNL